MAEDDLNDPLNQLSDLTLNSSVFDGVTPLSDEDIKHLFANVDVYVDDASNNDEEDIQDAASAFSNYSTPYSAVHRSGTTFATAKKWLTAWLTIAKLYHCPVTLNPIAPNRTNHMAHIMLPQAAPPHAVKLTGQILSMSPREMCMHSRLFFMPLRSDVHSLVDMHRVFLLVSKDILELLAAYLRRPLVDTEGQSEWSQLRKGSLSGFGALREGIVYECTLLCSPHFADQPSLRHGDETLFKRPYTNFPPIQTHVTPFALAFHALRVLENATSPMEFDFQYIFRSRNRHDLNSLQDLLERALATNKGNKDRPHDITPGIPDHVAAFLDFIRKLSKSLRSGGSSSHRRGSIGDSSHHSHHSRRSHPELPGTPTPSSSTRSHTRSQTKAGRTPASDVREEYLATLSLCHLDPRYLSPDASPNLVIPNSTQKSTQAALDGASSVSSSPSAGLPAPPSQTRVVGPAQPHLFKRLIRSMSLWMTEHGGAETTKLDRQIAAGPHASWSVAARFTSKRGSNSRCCLYCIFYECLHLSL
ncbi:hypothetical protein BDP27DRAFT_1434237 [Rhodocollybia butyracea]|uniref:Uncharacterized protein n=1 Tax=Rhodocollybia butyracea TaxID=206335 RepID=A0A9P5P6D9_9AGAR|nr:hypothetical protein BDP27DRAFT_1434237 [Rhodocollybia butyracea]